MNDNNKSIFVTGDISLDHYIQLGNRPYSDSPKNIAGSHYSTIKGGAYLIYDFLLALNNKNRVRFGLNMNLFRRLPSQNNSYATIASCKDGKDNKEEAWRIDKQFGFGSFSENIDYAIGNQDRDVSSHDIIIIDDAGLDFASHVNKETAWPILESFYRQEDEKKGDKLVIYKKSGDLKKGELLKELLQESDEGKINLLTIVSIKDIRFQDARVSSGISWEQTALDLVYELQHNIRLTDLLKSKFIVIPVNSSGAVFLAKKADDTFEYKLIFDPLHLEDEWEKTLCGTVTGRMSCFTAALATTLQLEKPFKNYMLEEAIIFGLQSVRGFFKSGYFASKTGIKLPLDRIQEVSIIYSNTFSQTYIPAPGKILSYLDCDWTILKDNYDDEVNNNTHASVLTNQETAGKEISVLQSDNPLINTARNVVMNGRVVLNNIPSLTLGQLFTVDRNEIENLRNIKMLMESYRNKKGVKIPPLSIAVFGLPGSGKSFGVKEIGKGVLGDKVPILEFNLSQFNGPNDLIGAFHQVRDEVLKGTIPLVFWDEFDSKNYEWLQYLLAPMQDGCFQEGQVTHTIGKCIMVFAGGTSYKMEAFGIFNENSQHDKNEDFKLKKGPDFISRIHGYINILGPNPGLAFNKETARWDIDPSDSCYPVRRSLFIRQILGLAENEMLNIEWGLLNALLKVGKYKHGARSLSNLLKNLRDNSDGKRIMRCHLPSNTILELYIDDISDFFEKLNENQKYNEHVFDMAQAIHKAWQQYSKIKNIDYDKEYSMLPVFMKASNVDAAYRIPKILDIAKLKIVSSENANTFSSDEYVAYINDKNGYFLEKMAEKEHELWMKFYVDNDWKYDIIRNDYMKLHNCIVAYNSGLLSEDDKDKDRTQVKMYWQILNDVDFGIAKE